MHLFSQTAGVPYKVAIVKAHYEKINTLLDYYKIPYTIIPHKNLESYDVLSKYDIIFFPCGIGVEPDTSINILSRGTKLHGIELKDDYYKIDEKKSSVTIENFISNGGIAIFSDFSMSLMNDALGYFSFYKNFPTLGLSGTYNATTDENFFTFAKQHFYPVTFKHSAWFVCKEAQNASVFLSAKINTPIGQKQAVIAGAINHDDGIAFFSSFHDDN